jgi:hypothetical protein
MINQTATKVLGISSVLAIVGLLALGIWFNTAPKFAHSAEFTPVAQVNVEIGAAEYTPEPTVTVAKVEQVKMHKTVTKVTQRACTSYAMYNHGVSAPGYENVKICE